MTGFHCRQVLAMSFEFILPFLRPIEPSFRRTTKRIATGLAPRKELKRRPFLGLHPDFAVPPNASPNRNFSAATRTRSE
jgi:hypothetical protein